MQLTVWERIKLLGILPAVGDVTTLKIVRQLSDDLGFSEEEHKLLDIRVDEGRVHWKAMADPLKDVEMGAKAKALIAKVLKGLSDKEQLGLDALPLYEKFCTDDEA